MFSNNLLMAAAGGGGAGYVIEGSALFDGSSAYLSRTPASAGNRKTWTQSGWIKRGALTASGQYPFLNTNTGGNDGSVLHANDDFQWLHASYNYRETDAVLRDEGGWYHIVWNLDTTLSASTAVRSKCWINGVEQAYHYDQDGPAEDLEPQLNNNVLHGIGYNIYDGRNYYDGYLAEYIFIDGLALDHTYFGETDSTTGQWIPKDPSGLTFGTNGFWLGGGANIANGIDSSATSTTAATIAYCAQSSTDSNLTDYSGSFDGISIGTATATRYVAVTINGPRATAGARTVSTVTDSTSTTDFSLVVRQTSDNGDAHEIWISDSPITSGTTANIDIVFSSSMGACAISTWELNNIDITSPLTASEEGTSLSEPINIPANAVCLAAGRVISNYRATWAGVAEAYDVNFNGENGGDTAGSSSTSANPTTVSCTFSSTHTDNTMCVAVFLPADGPLNHFTKSGTITATNDSPTNDADNDYSNYCTWNPLDANDTADITLSDGNRTAAKSTTGHDSMTGTLRFAQDAKVYWEVEWIVNGNDEAYIGMWDTTSATVRTAQLGAVTGGVDFLSNPGASSAVSTRVNGGSRNVLTDTQAMAVGDVVRFAYNNGNLMVGYRASGGGVDKWFDSGDPVAGTDWHETGLTGLFTPAFSSGVSANTFKLLCDPGEFKSTIPTGYVPIGTATMPTPAIPDPTDHHHVGLVNHDGTSTAGTCSFDLDTYDWLAIIKNRDNIEKWFVIDSLRGSNIYHSFESSLVETTDSNVLTVSATTYTLGSTLVADNYVVEFHKAGLQASRDTANSGTIGDPGFIRSTNSTTDFSIITFDGDGIDGVTLEHGHSDTPDFSIIKRRDVGNNESIAKHVNLNGGMTGTYSMSLSTNAAETVTLGSGWFTASSTLFTLTEGGSTDDNVNDSSSKYVMYSWKAVEGYSAFGSYEGNSGDGPVVNVGMAPLSYFVKDIDATGWWQKMETVGGCVINGDTNATYYNSTYAETDENSGSQIDALSVGFKPYGTSAQTNTAGTYIYGIWGGRPIQGPKPASNTSQGRAR